MKEIEETCGCDAYICPYCGYRECNAVEKLELADGESTVIECPQCGRQFEVTACVEVWFRARKAGERWQELEAERRKLKEFPQKVKEAEKAGNYKKAISLLRQQCALAKELVSRFREKLRFQFYMSLPYTIEIVPYPDGGFFARIKELEGCMTEGETLEETLELLGDAKKAWLEAALESGVEIPLPGAVK